MIADHSRGPRWFPSEPDDQEMAEGMAEELLGTPTETYRRIDLNDPAREDVYVHNGRYFVPFGEASSPVIIFVREDVFVAGAADVVPGGKSP